MDYNKINGFEDEEILSLYRFLKSYENKCLKRSSETDALQKYPSLKKIKDVLNSFKYKEKTKAELESIDINSLDNEFYFTEHISDLMGILYHIRNSIAHANMEKDGKRVIISDYDNKKTKQYTTKGVIDFYYLEKIISIIDTAQSN